jgi:hypothetical protein
LIELAVRTPSIVARPGHAIAHAAFALAFLAQARSEKTFNAVRDALGHAVFVVTSGGGSESESLLRWWAAVTPAHGLAGCWRMIRSDDVDAEPAEADFRPEGRLFYSIASGDRWQVMRLQYRVEGNVIVTDQPSAPAEERTAFAIESDGTLRLEFGGQRSWFARAAKTAPEVEP